MALRTGEQRFTCCSLHCRRTQDSPRKCPPAFPTGVLLPSATGSVRNRDSGTASCGEMLAAEAESSSSRAEPTVCERYARFRIGRTLVGRRDHTVSRDLLCHLLHLSSVCSGSQPFHCMEPYRYVRNVPDWNPRRIDVEAAQTMLVASMLLDCCRVLLLAAGEARGISCPPVLISDFKIQTGAPTN